MNIVGIITARGGSKSIPRKNLAVVAGKPLIAWTIEAALHSKVFHRVLVSTDDEEIAQVAQVLGAEVPFRRPADLAQDETPSILAVLHVLEWLDQHEGYAPEYFMILQPTSPLRSSADVVAAVELARRTGADSVISVSPGGHHPFWALRVDAEGRLSGFLAGDWREQQRGYPRRQDLPPAFFENGAIYLAKSSVAREICSLYGESLHGYIMPQERSLDVDTPLDLVLADHLLRTRDVGAGC